GDQTGVKVTDDAEVTTPKGFKEGYQQYAEGGWGSLQFEPEYGGQGLPFALAIPVQEMWHAANMAWGLCPLLTQGAIEALEASASDELKEKFLPNMIAGTWTGTMNLTESQSGSDMATLKAKAEREGDHYRIFGQKIYITWGEHDMVENIIHLVLARLPDAPAGVKGISLFLVPKFLVNEDGSLGERNDVKVVSTEHKLGVHASPTCVMSYGDNDGAIGYLVGEEHQGLKCMFKMMNNARLTVGLQGVSISERAYQQARDYANERVQGVAPGQSDFGPIIHHPDVRRMLMTMRSMTEASRALAYVACSSVDFRNKATDDQTRLDHSARSQLLTPIVKGWTTEIAQEITSLGVQIHGGMGFIEETGAAQHYRDARILPIYEGTNGIQAADLVGRKMQGDGGRAIDSLIAEIRAVIADANSKTPELTTMSAQLERSVDALEQAKVMLLAESQKDENFAGSVSYNLLMLMGYVCGGWQMLIGAVAATAEKESKSHPFYAQKLATSQFYMSNVLPRYSSFAEMIQAGSATTMAMAADAF
ncbi:MAG: acyl-CoA dehydrogenase, partial [Pseudomonadota bacterium]